MARHSRGLERFAADLPAVERFVSLGEGDTPVLPLPSLARRLGLRRLSAKMESLNPTGSYKDRVAAMALSLARQQGKAGWIGTSSGNAGLAMAAYGARAGLPGFLCLVAEAPLEKRLPLMSYPVRILGVAGIGTRSTGVAVAGLIETVRAASVRHDLYLCITANALDPDGMRGVDTIAYELAEQAPDSTHVYVPVGGGGLLVSIARGLERRGMLSRVIASQPAGCSPIVQFLRGEASEPNVARCDSGISALQIPRPPDGELAAAAVVKSRGWGTTASDGDILAAQRLLAGTEGLFVEPAAAVGLAALIEDVGQGRLEEGAHPVLILTGAGWKDLGRLQADAGRLRVEDIADVGRLVDEWMAAPDREGGLDERR